MPDVHLPSLATGLLIGAAAVFLAALVLWKQLRDLRHAALVEDAARAALLEKQLRELDKENEALRTENRKANRKLKKIVDRLPGGMR